MGIYLLLCKSHVEYKNRSRGIGGISFRKVQVEFDCHNIIIIIVNFLQQYVHEYPASKERYREVYLHAVGAVVCWKYLGTCPVHFLISQNYKISFFLSYSVCSQLYLMPINAPHYVDSAQLASYKKWALKITANKFGSYKAKKALCSLSLQDYVRTSEPYDQKQSQRNTNIAQEQSERAF